MGTVDHDDDFSALAFVHRTPASELDELLAYRKRLRRELEDYQRNVPPHVRAARMADERNERRGERFSCATAAVAASAT
jgi:hypothetical protein